MERYMILIRTDGTGRLIRCDDGDTCKLETLQQLVGGLIETADSCLEPGWAREPVDSIKLIVNEEGDESVPVRLYERHRGHSSAGGCTRG